MRFVIFPLHLSKLLRATTACNFSSLICPAGSAPAALASLLFDPPEPQIIWKTQCFVTFLPFRAPRSSFFFSSLLFSSLTLPISAFHLSTLSEVWLVNFLRSYPYVPSSSACWDSISGYGTGASRIQGARNWNATPKPEPLLLLG